MCFWWHILRSYRFVAEVTFKQNIASVVFCTIESSRHLGHSQWNIFKSEVSKSKLPNCHYSGAVFVTEKKLIFIAFSKKTPFFGKIVIFSQQKIPA